MRKILLLCTILAIVSALAAPAAHAVGFGFYGSAGVGSADWDEDYLSGSNPKFTTDTKHRSFGITLDTALSSDRFFNYHLNIGREWFTSKDFIARDNSGLPSAGAGNIEFKGMMMSHTFGFGAKISDSVRLWLGPEIRWYLGLKGSPNNAPGYDVDGAGFAFGPSIGVNFNFPSGLTLMIKGGYMMTKYSLDGDGYIGGAYANNSYDVDETMTYVNFEFLLRTPGDR